MFVAHTSFPAPFPVCDRHQLTRRVGWSSKGQHVCESVRVCVQERAYRSKEASIHTYSVDTRVRACLHLSILHLSPS